MVIGTVNRVMWRAGCWQQLARTAVTRAIGRIKASVKKRATEVI